MTERDWDVLAAIDNLIGAHGYSPSFREIGKEVGLRSSGSVSRHILKLERAGLVTQRPGQQRTLRVTGKGYDGLFERER